MSEFICFIMAVPMALHLVRKRQVEVPRGFGVWLLFLLWVVLGFFVLQVSAVGAVADSSSTRYITWAYRLTWYLTITIVLLYIINTRREFSLTRVARIMSMLFLTVVAGGILGVFAPHFEFPSLLEIILPQSISKIQFISKMIHPSAAQLQEVLGYEAPRPSAPYAFTNTWGLNFVCTLPFFILGWCLRGSGWRRFFAPVVLVLAAIPAIYSINRGMWLALIVMALFLAIRAAFIGRPAMLLTVIAGGAALVMIVALTSLGAVVKTRLTSDGSEEGRANLGTLAVTSVTETSPFIGLGSTRNVQGNFNTIAGGARADCPRCSPPALGTQGQLWLVVFSQGIIGLLFYLFFFGGVFFKHLSIRSAEASTALTVLVASVVTMPVYNSLGTGLMVTMVAVAVLVREGIRENLPDPIRTFSKFSRPVIRWWPIIAACTIMGLLVAQVALKAQGKIVNATTTIVMPQPPDFASISPAVGPIAATTTDGPMSMDTLGQLLSSSTVLDAVATATGRRPEFDDGTIKVRATANSRTLHVSVQAPNVSEASAGSIAAANALLEVRQAQIEKERSRHVAALQERSASLNAATASLVEPIEALVPGKTRQLPIWATYSLRAKRTSLKAEAVVVNNQLARVQSAKMIAGSVTQPTSAKFKVGSRSVFLGSGLALGLAIGFMLAIGFGRRGRRIGNSRMVHDDVNLPILATMQVDDLRIAQDSITQRRGRPSVVGAIDVAVQVHNFGSCIPATEQDDGLRDIASGLMQVAAVRHGSIDRAVIIARSETRSSQISRVSDQAALRGQSVIGVIVVVSNSSGWRKNRALPMIDTRRWSAQAERNTRVKNGR